MGFSRYFNFWGTPFGKGRCLEWHELDRDIAYKKYSQHGDTNNQDMVYTFSMEEVSHALERCLRERAKAAIS